MIQAAIRRPIVPDLRGVMHAFPCLDVVCGRMMDGGQQFLCETSRMSVGLMDLRIIERISNSETQSGIQVSGDSVQAAVSPIILRSAS
jgi:hypothetical protein